MRHQTPRTHGGSNGCGVVLQMLGNPASTAVVTTIRPAIPKLGQFSYAPSPNFTTQRFASLAAEQGPATE